MKLYIFLFISVILLACSRNNSGNRTNSSEKTYSEKLSYKGKNCKTKIVDNDFVYKPFGEDITIKKIKLLLKTDYNLKIEAQTDSYDSKKIDSIFIFKSNKSKLIFKKVQGDKDLSAFESGYIKDLVITFNRGIHIGMNKVDFLKKFMNKNGATCDSIKVDSEDQTFNNWFIFRDDTLNTIIWGSGL
jgi:hypothetical protein